MRIMHLVLRPRFSGAEILARDLCLLQKFEHDVCYASLDHPEDDFASVLVELDTAGVIVLVPVGTQPAGRMLRRAARIRQLFSALRQFAPDVVFAHSQLPTWYASVVACGSRVDLIKVIHSASGERYTWFDWVFTKRGSKVIGVDQRGLNMYLEGARARVRPFHVPNGVDVVRFQEALPVSRPTDRKIVLQVGRICDVKGQIQSLRALIALGRDDIEFWVAGIKEDPGYFQRLLLPRSLLDGSMCSLSDGHG